MQCTNAHTSMSVAGLFLESPTMTVRGLACAVMRQCHARVYAMMPAWNPGVFACTPLPGDCTINASTSPGLPICHLSCLSFCLFVLTLKRAASQPVLDQVGIV